MESMVLFSQLVLGVCAMHLISRSSELMARWRAKSRGEQSLSAASSKKVVRDDWYVFFHCRDLWGKEPAESTGQERKSIEKTSPRRDSRPNVRV